MAELLNARFCIKMFGAFFGFIDSGFAYAIYETGRGYSKFIFESRAGSGLEKAW